MGLDLRKEGLGRSIRCRGLDELIQLATDGVDLPKGRDGGGGQGQPAQEKHPGKAHPGAPHGDEEAGEKLSKLTSFRKVIKTVQDAALKIDLKNLGR